MLLIFQATPELQQNSASIWHLVIVSNNTSMHPHHAAKVDSKDESEKLFPPVCLHKLSALLLAGASWSFSKATTMATGLFTS